MKKLNIKRIIAMLLALVLCVGAIPLASIHASAASNWPSLSDSSYCEFTATKTIYVYRDMSFSARGTCIPSKSYNAYIETGDVCKIYYITSRAILVGYPVAGGSYRVGYIKRSDLFGVSAPASCVTAKGKATTYITPGGSSYGYTEAGDKVYDCGDTSSGYKIIIYSAKSGDRAYKIGFVKASDYKAKIAPYSDGGNPSVQVKLNVPLYKQYDSRWSNRYIGSKTIGQVGCTTTCIAMVYSYNTGTTVYPNSMVSKLRYANNDLYWSSISNVGLTSVSYNCGLTNTIMANIYSKLKAGRPVIIGASSGGRYQHWVVITGYTGNSTSAFSPSDFIVNDPGSQGAMTLAAFLANGSRTDRTVIIRIMY